MLIRGCRQKIEIRQISETLFALPRRGKPLKPRVGTPLKPREGTPLKPREGTPLVAALLLRGWVLEGLSAPPTARLGVGGAYCPYY